MIRFLTGILTLLIISSCSYSQELQTKDIVGRYESSPVYGVYYSMELYQNSTYEYYWVTGLINGKTKGSWELQGNNVVFNSDIQLSDIAYEVQQKPSRNADSFKIIVFNETGDTLPYAYCTLKAGSSVLLRDTADFNGMVTIQRLNTADSIIIESIGHRTIRHSLDSSKTDLTFWMPSDSYYRYFNNERWKIKQDILYDRSSKKGLFNRKRKLKRNRTPFNNQ